MKLKLSLLMSILSCFFLRCHESMPNIKKSGQADSDTIRMTNPNKRATEGQYPLLVVVIMIKNEEDVIEATLQPFIDAGVDSFFVFDTGSTDKTVDVTKQFFMKNYKLLYKSVIAQEPFIDFATSRNRALELAHKQFPDAVFMIMPDAEWYIKHVDKLLDFCKSQIDSPQPCYLIRLKSVNSEFDACRLIRCNAGMKFGGVVHESICYATRERVPAPVCFDLSITQKGHQKTIDRFKRDYELLSKEYKKNPHDPRTVFYFAQTCASCGEKTQAYKLYKQRVKLAGWDEENYIAMYRLAELTQQLFPDQLGWQKAEKRYLRAWKMRPHRAEPLVKLAQNYAYKDNALSFLYAQRACQLPYPENDVLFIDKTAYDYVRYNILGIVSWYVQEYNKGEKAVRKLLEKYPDDATLQYNLACYVGSKNTESTKSFEK